MTPMADLVARQRTVPPAIVSFTPAFWLLVPGAIGLVGVAALLSDDSTGTTTLVTTVETMVAIALGVLVGRRIAHCLHARGLKLGLRSLTPAWIRDSHVRCRGNCILDECLGSPTLPVRT